MKFKICTLFLATMVSINTLSTDCRASLNAGLSAALQEQIEEAIELQKQKECYEDRKIKEIKKKKQEKPINWKNCNKTKYCATMSLYVRKQPSKTADIIGSLTYNQSVKITGTSKDTNFLRCKYNGNTGYIHKDYLSKHEMPYRYGDVPGNNSFKSYMPYSAITSAGSKQYQLQHSVAYTGTYGIRMIGGRFCVAIGSYYHNPIGGIFDIVMQNGTVIPCISADQKADTHTDWTHRQTLHDGSIVEFLVDPGSLYSKISESGNVGSANTGWTGEIAYFKLYDVIN